MSVIALVLFCIPIPSAAISNQEVQSSVPADASRTWIEPDSTYTRQYRCRWGDVFFGDVMVESSAMIDLQICDSENYELWESGYSASFVISIENINNYTWSFDVPINSTWYIIVHNPGSDEIRVSATYQCTTRLRTVLVPLIYISQVGASIVIIGIFLSRFFRKSRLSESSDPSQSSIDSEPALGSLDKIESGILIVQSTSLLVMSFLLIQSYYPATDISGGIGIAAVIVFLIPMAIIPLLCAFSILTNRTFHNQLLILWALISIFYGNLYTSTWLISSSDDTIFFGLAFLVPTWLTLAYIAIRYDKRKTSTDQKYSW